MNIKKIILEEINDFEWAEDITEEGAIWNILDSHFGVWLGGDGVPHTRLGEITTFLTLNRTGLRTLYTIVTGSKWYKTIMSKEYQEMKDTLRKWKSNRYMALAKDDVVAQYIRRRGSRDTGPR